MKLSELVTEENMGKVRVWHESLQEGQYFTPYFINGTKYCHGLIGDEANDFHLLDDGWELYTEPPKTKKKIVLYQWWDMETERLSEHKTDDKAKADLWGDKWTKIESTRLVIEVPDER